MEVKYLLHSIISINKYTIFLHLFQKQFGDKYMKKILKVHQAIRIRF